jgi:hypothetical protein
MRNVKMATTSKNTKKDLNTMIAYASRYKACLSYLYIIYRLNDRSFMIVIGHSLKIYQKCTFLNQLNTRIKLQEIHFYHTWILKYSEYLTKFF